MVNGATQKFTVKVLVYNLHRNTLFLELYCALPSPINYSNNKFETIKLKDSSELTCQKGFLSTLNNDGKFKCESVGKSVFEPKFEEIQCKGKIC